MLRSLSLTFLLLAAGPTAASAADGDLDPSFNAGGWRVVAFQLGSGHDDRADAVLVQPDGKVLLAGTAAKASATVPDSDFAVARLLAEGQPDPAFSADGRATIAFDLATTGHRDRATSLALQVDGRIVVCGLAEAGAAPSESKIVLARLNADGTRDLSFAGDGAQELYAGFSLEDWSDRPCSMLVLRNGKIVIPYGNPDGSDLGLIRLEPDGDLDGTYGPLANGYSENARFSMTDPGKLLAAVELPDGDVLAVGFLETGSGEKALLAVRFEENGDLDDAFGTAGIAVHESPVAGNAVATHAALQHGGRLVVLARGEGNGADRLVRLHTRGAATSTRRSAATAGAR